MPTDQNTEYVASKKFWKKSEQLTWQKHLSTASGSLFGDTLKSQAPTGITVNSTSAEKLMQVNCAEPLNLTMFIMSIYVVPVNTNSCFN